MNNKAPSGFEYFVESGNDPFWKRVLYFLLSLSVLYFAMYIFNPYVSRHIRPFFSAFGDNQRLFFRHLLLFSFSSAVFTYLFLVVSAKLKIIKPVFHIRVI
jgi:hypothetical protein